eukprot:COSAG05_NODE_5954_length_1052_cov_1.253935_2_plen_76_part_00
MQIKPSKQEHDADGVLNDVVTLDAPERPGMVYKKAGDFVDPSTRLDMRDIPCPSVNVNFLPRAFTNLNGATRFKC